MVEILRRGPDEPAPATYKAECGRCGSLLGVESDECRTLGDSRGQTQIEVTCPVCGFNVVAVVKETA